MQGFQPESPTNLTDSHGLSVGFVFAFKHIGGLADSPSQGRGAVAGPVRAPRQLRAGSSPWCLAGLDRATVDSPNLASCRLFFKVKRIRGVSVTAWSLPRVGATAQVPSAPCLSGRRPWDSGPRLTCHTHSPVFASLLNENLLPACHSP